jgi:hypothetical protein
LKACKVPSVFERRIEPADGLLGPGDNMLVRYDADMELPRGIGDAHPAVGRELRNETRITPALNPERLDRARRVPLTCVRPSAYWQTANKLNAPM